ALASGRHRRSLALPLTLMGAGAAIGLSSIGTGLASNAALGELERECVDGLCDRGKSSIIDNGRALAITTDVLWATGAAVLVTGLILLVVARNDSDTPPVTAGCDETGCEMNVRASF